MRVVVSLSFSNNIMDVKKLTLLLLQVKLNQTQQRYVCGTFSKLHETKSLRTHYYASQTTHYYKKQKLSNG